MKCSRCDRDSQQGNLCVRCEDFDRAIMAVNSLLDYTMKSPWLLETSRTYLKKAAEQEGCLGPGL